MIIFAEYIKELKRIPEYEFYWSRKKETEKYPFVGSFNKELYCKFLKTRII